ncbi:MAG: PQQ-dependent sugar dehydrogenase, partial [Flavisolibacter sp.]
MSRKFYAASAVMAVFVFSYNINAQAPTITYESPAFISGLTAPVDLVNAGDGSNRLFIVQQNGLIRVRQGTSPFTISNFLDLGSSGLDLISYIAGGERGLLSMVFHPDYNGTTNRYFFVYYTEKTTGRIVVRRFETSAGDQNIVDVSSSFLIMAVDHPGQSNHNGGKLNFGPDGYLYFALGDGGSGNDPPNNAQNGNMLLGKMIRIDVTSTPTSQTFGNYVIPPSNPYVSDPTVLDEIWALGLRNPFRWSFDRANGDMWIGDVGQSAREEIDYRPAGSTGHVNYGWSCYEGSISNPSTSVVGCTAADKVFPIFDYVNPTIGQAVIGGYVYRGPDNPTLTGRYIATDAYKGN